MAENEQLRIVNKGSSSNRTLRKMAEIVVDECCSHCVGAEGSPCLANTPSEVLVALNNDRGLCKFAAVEAEKPGYVYLGILYKVSDQINFEPVGLPVPIQQYYESLLKPKDKNL